jgi:hypothetical protein
MTQLSREEFSFRVRRLRTVLAAIKPDHYRRECRHWRHLRANVCDNRKYVTSAIEAYSSGRKSLPPRVLELLGS